MKQSDIINGWRQLINPKDANYFKNKLLNLVFFANKLSDDEMSVESAKLASEIEQYKTGYQTINKNKINENSVQNKSGFSQDYFKAKIFDLIKPSKLANIDRVNQIVDEIEQYKKSKKV